MARIRTVKPALFRHEDLYRAEAKAKLPLRLAFIGLFTVADREGRFKWRPAEIKLDVFPYESKLNFTKVLEALEDGGFIRRYSVDGEVFGFIPKFGSHQLINTREAHSSLPAPNNSNILATRGSRDTTLHVQGNAMHVHAHGEGKGKGREEEKEGKGTENSPAHPRVTTRESDRADRVVLLEFESIREVITERGVTETVQRAWLDAFPDAPWIVTEVRKALAWESASPKRRKKLFGAFMTNWMNRGWDKRRVEVGSSGRGIADLMSEDQDRLL